MTGQSLVTGSPGCLKAVNFLLSFRHWQVKKDRANSFQLLEPRLIKGLLSAFVEAHLLIAASWIDEILSFVISSRVFESERRFRLTPCGMWSDRGSYVSTWADKTRRETRLFLLNETWPLGVGPATSTGGASLQQDRLGYDWSSWPRGLAAQPESHETSCLAPASQGQCAAICVCICTHSPPRRVGAAVPNR